MMLVGDGDGDGDGGGGGGEDIDERGVGRGFKYR